MSRLVYFSSVSGYTARFVEKLGRDADRIPLYPSEPFLHVDEPYVLFLPTYGGGNGEAETKRTMFHDISCLNAPWESA